MNHCAGQRGTSLVAVFIIIMVISTAINLSLLRTGAGLDLVQNRYWTGVARDLAENGFEYERSMAANGKMAAKTDPHRVEVGMFAGLAGIFESHGRTLEAGSIEIVSRGELLNRDGIIKFSLDITARLRTRPDGSRQTVTWTETHVNPE